MSVQIEFGCPTLRYGAVCGTIKDNLDLDNAKLVRLLLKKRWIDSFPQACISSKDFGLINIIDTNSNFFEESGEGPIILFPEYIAIFSNEKKNFRASMRSSVTICVNPNHSKVWTRLSYLPFEDESPLDADSVKLFLSGAKDIGKKFTPFIKDIYKKSLNDAGYAETLDTIHEITIEVISTNKKIEKIFEKSRKDSSESSDNVASNIIKDFGLIELIDSTKQINIGNCILADQKSISTKGLIIQYNAIKMSKFVCIINERIKSPLKNFEKTKNFGKKLIRLIAISI